jgi:hypothetical protein
MTRLPLAVPSKKQSDSFWNLSISKMVMILGTLVSRKNLKYNGLCFSFLNWIKKKGKVAKKWMRNLPDTQYLLAMAMCVVSFSVSTSFGSRMKLKIMSSVKKMKTTISN